MTANPSDTLERLWEQMHELPPSLAEYRALLDIAEAARDLVLFIRDRDDNYDVGMPAAGDFQAMVDDAWERLRGALASLDAAGGAER